MSESQFQIHENLPDHAYRTEIPNIIFEIKLNHYQQAVYFFLKRVAGDGGGCWYSFPKMEEILGISQTKIRECINDLVNGNNSIGLKLIKKTERTKTDGGRDTCLFTIIDIWKVNGEFFREKRKKKIEEGGSVQYEGGMVRHTNHPGSPGDDKEELSKEEQKTSSSGTVVAVSMNGSFISLENKAICEKFERMFNSLVPEYGSKWRLPFSFFQILIEKYGASYVEANLIYIIEKQRDAASDEQNPYKKNPTKRIENPKTYIRLACEKNYALAVDKKSEK